MPTTRMRILIDENSNPFTIQLVPDEDIELEGDIVTSQSEEGGTINEWQGDFLGFAPFPTNGSGWRWEVRFAGASPFLQTTFDSELSFGEPMPPIPPDLTDDPDENPGLVPEVGSAVTAVPNFTEAEFSYEIKAFQGAVESQSILRKMRIRRRLG